MMRNVSFIFGTRPEAIKLCPLILAMRDHSEFETHVCVTGQHREMLDQVLEVFGVTPDVDLALMQPNQSLGGLTSRAIAAIDAYLDRENPDLILVQGDTTTVFCAALCAFYHRIPVGHIEAGLRTWNPGSPFPEEINRVLATRLSDLHFAPTTGSRDNLLKEGIPADRIFVTGNTVIDALFIALDKVGKDLPPIPGLPQFLQPTSHSPRGTSHNPVPRLVLITGHRRESFGDGFQNICRAIATLSNCFPDVDFVYPVHLNPNVREPVKELLGGRANVHLIEPLSYLPFVSLLDASHLVLTDSGGIQEEAPSLAKPVLVMRDTTERPEAVAAGTARLVGADTARIVSAVTELLTDPDARTRMLGVTNPYGDGQASARIVGIIETWFATETAPQ